MQTAPFYISIIVPALNEAEHLPDTLRVLQPLRDLGHEVIVVDGGSEDATLEIATHAADRVLSASRGRARQMNVGASVAHGDLLVFLHADTLVPPAALLELESLDECPDWGRFDVRLTGTHPGLRVVEWMISRRSRLVGSATGDQAMFVRRDWFEELGGFPEIPLMEDLALSRMLRKRCRPLCPKTPVLTSSRRWEEHGVARTVLTMWRVRISYYLGVSPDRLSEMYRGQPRSEDAACEQ